MPNIYMLVASSAYLTVFIFRQQTMQILGFIGVFGDNKQQVAVKKKHRKCGKEGKSKGEIIMPSWERGKK